MKRIATVAAALAATALISACGGGSSALPVPGPSASPGSTTGTVRFTFVVPPQPSPIAVGRVRRNITTPDNAQSASILLQTTGGSPVGTGPAPTVVDFTAGSPNCTSANGTLTCVAQVIAPAAADGFFVTLYPQANSQESALGGGSLLVQVIGGQTVDAPATLSGTIATAQVVPGIASVGSAATVPLTIVAKDANGDTILGTYATPIALSDSDVSGQTALSTTTIPDSTTASTVTLSYKGGSMASPALIAPSVAGLPASAMTNGSFLPSSVAPSTNGSTESIVSLTYGSASNMSGSSPVPLPTATALIDERVTTGTTFNGVANAIENHDTVASGAGENDYFLWVPGTTSASLVFLGLQDIAPNGTSLGVETCSAPYQVVFVDPIPTGFDRYAGSGPCATSFTGTSAGMTSTESGTYYADGSYSSVVTTTSSSNAVATTSATLQSNGTETLVKNNAANSLVMTIGTPAPLSSSIPVTYTQYAGPLPSPGVSTPVPTATSIPNFYTAIFPASSPVPQPLRTDTYNDKGMTTLPSVCAIPSSLVASNAPVHEIDENSGYVNPEGDAAENVIRHFYVDGIGDVCDVESSRVVTEDVLDVALGRSTVPPSVATLTSLRYLTAASIKAAAVRYGVSDALRFAAGALELRRASRREPLLPGHPANMMP